MHEYSVSEANRESQREVEEHSLESPFPALPLLRVLVH